MPGLRWKGPGDRMTLKHTPGPWRWDETHVGDGPNKLVCGGSLMAANGDSLVETDGGCYPPFDGDRILIAKAPELLSALRGLLKTQGDTGWRDALDYARTLLAEIDGDR